MRMRGVWFQRLAHNRALAVITAIATVGAIVVTATKAATFQAIAEAESGTVNGASIIADATASGGNAVQFVARTTSPNCEAGSSNPSGFILPTGDLTSNGSMWEQVYADDFNSDPFTKPKWNDGIVVSGSAGESSPSADQDYMLDPLKKADLLANKYNIWTKHHGQDLAFTTSWWDASSVTVGNSCMKLASQFDATRGTFLTGGVATSYLHNVKYGRWEAAFRMDTSEKVKYAMMLYGRSASWPTYVEMDLAEGNAEAALPYNDSFFTTNHFGQPSPNNKKKTIATGVKPSDGTTINEWHRLAVEWKPGRLDYYLDGTRFATVISLAYAPTGTQEDSYCPSIIKTRPCYVPANAIPDALSGQDGSDLGLRRFVFQTETARTGVTDTTFKPAAYLDWVAIYRLKQ